MSGSHPSETPNLFQFLRTQPKGEPFGIPSLGSYEGNPTPIFTILGEKTFNTFKPPLLPPKAGK